uniref:Inositol-tetrakisphosphate 1-kinase n=1 Tax=Schistosoma mansoni TaxID=6183 RepID=A0A5K4EJR4_SCHMA
MKVVGVWMSDSKVDSIGLNSLLHEKRSDLIFRKINPCISISEQGPFDVVLHKIPEFLSGDSSKRGQKIIESFINYAKNNPHVLFIDSPMSLRCLLTRLNQFSSLQDIIRMSDIRNEIFVPKFCLLSQKEPTKLCEAGISYPIDSYCFQ